ncbi:MAG: NAD(+) diphosphatase [Gammaproteobacteria bacterium]|nr:NAD(+) diphosphatase [Gammaproteobacteria bacterium]
MKGVKQRYTGCALDRASGFRKDPVWIAERFADPGARILPVWRNRNLIAQTGRVDEAPTLVALPRNLANHVLERASEKVFLGMDDNVALFAADISLVSRTDANQIAGKAEFLDLRRVGPTMEADAAALAAYARSELRWHRYSHYCGHCGAATESCSGGHVRVCTDKACNREIYPRTDPAVIMLVEERSSDHSPPRCLLARHHRSPSGSYSTLAGFVEPGESLEEAVAREVFEEVGVRLTSVSYQDSQPWPFPASIMLGFRAVAKTTEIVIDQCEIGDARWFTPDEISRFGEWGDPQAKQRLSPKDSIARYLIDSWMRDVARR